MYYTAVDPVSIAYIVNRNITGTSGNDDIVGTNDDDFIKGLAGRDTLSGGTGSDTILGGNGRDKLFGQDGNDTLDGGAGKDLILGGQGKDTIMLSAGADKINGGGGHDTLDASNLTGGVVVNASALDKGFPRILPGTITLADATMQSVKGIESFVGSKFDDVFFGDAANSVLLGRAGDDRLETSGAGSRLLGGNGNDRLRGDGEDIKLVGGKGEDSIFAFGFGMTALGGKGDDTIYINRGDGDKDSPVSIIRGGAGDDVIKWLESDLRLEIDERLKVFGGAGADTFDFGFFQEGTIQDFQPGIDKIALRTHLDKEDPTGAILIDMITDTARGAVLTLDFDSIFGVSFRFIGVQAADFTENDFIF